MEKCKKLSLKKRKTTSTHLPNIKQTRVSNEENFEGPTSPANVSSEGDQAGISAEQRQPTRSGKRAIAGIDDPNLEKLKELIMRVSSREKANRTELLPFPSMDMMENHSLQNLRDTHHVVQGRQLNTVPFTVSKDELLPFPDIPPEYKKRKKKTEGKEGIECPPSGKFSSSNSNQGSRKDQVDRNLSQNAQSDKMETEEQPRSRGIPLLPPQNAHLIRDWNSNYYSLQSRNQKQDDSTSEVSTSCIETSRNSATINPQSSQTNIDGRNSRTKASINTSAENNANKRNGRINAAKNSSAQNDSCDSLKNKEKRSVKLGASDQASTSGMNTFNNKNLGKTSNNEEIGRTNNDLEEQENLNIPKSVSNPNLSKEGDENSSEARKDSAMLEKCPLCQQVFEKSFTQMDVDSHIAQCLSYSEDDVMW